MSEPQLSVLMAHLNEGDEPIETVRSILETTPPGLVEIVAVDDCSESGKATDLAKLSAMSAVRSSRNEKRMGLFWCKDWLVSQAKTPNLMIIDAHMRFKKDNWAEKMLESIDAEPETIFCTTCLGLGWKGGPDRERRPLDVNKPNGRYFGATIVIRGKCNTRGGKRIQWLEPKWQRNMGETVYELPCVLGANYGLAKSWWNRIGGLRGLRAWGGQEAALSLRTWGAGGKCKIRTDIEIGHLFRHAAPYRPAFDAIWYNKMRMALTLLPKEIGRRLHAELAHKYPKPAALLREDNEGVLQDRLLARRIEKKADWFDDFVQKFKIRLDW